MTVKEQTAFAQQAASGADILRMRQVARQVPIAPAVEDYALRLVLATHPEAPDAPEIAKHCLRFGASPRAAQAILSTARVRALHQGRFNVAFEDVRFVAPACLRHRLALNFEALTEGVKMEDVIGQLLAQAEEK